MSAIVCQRRLEHRSWQQCVSNACVRAGASVLQAACRVVCVLQERGRMSAPPLVYITYCRDSRQQVGAWVWAWVCQFGSVLTSLPWYAAGLSAPVISVPHYSARVWCCAGIPNSACRHMEQPCAEHACTCMLCCGLRKHCSLSGPLGAQPSAFPAPGNGAFVFVESSQCH